MCKHDIRGILRFLERAENLKNTLRSSRTSAGRRESAAEHSWRLCLLAMVCSKMFPDADLETMLKIAVVHDLGEALCGDVPAPLQKDGDDRAGREREAVMDLCSSLPSDLAEELLGLWDAYDRGSSREAVVVKALDKLETLSQHNQGMNYGEIDYRFNLDYGTKQTCLVPELDDMRAAVDARTAANARGR